MVKSSPRDGNALSFSKMINLKLLIVSNARFSGEAGFLPNELRFVDWPEFSSSKYLPFDSNPKRLLKLNMPRSYMSGLGVGFKVFLIILIHCGILSREFIFLKLNCKMTKSLLLLLFCLTEFEKLDIYQFGKLYFPKRIPRRLWIPLLEGFESKVLRKFSSGSSFGWIS